MNRRAVNGSSVLARAVLAYSVHEHEVGSAKWIQLTLQRRSFTVQDDGRGIGLDKDGYVVGLLEQLSGRRGHVALHGVGLAIVAMSSPMLTIESRRGGRLSTQSYSWGIARGPIESQRVDGETGTRVTVVLPDEAPEIEIAEILDQVETWRVSHPLLTIDVIEEEHAL